MFPPGCNNNLYKPPENNWPPERIDAISSVAFPLSFFIFNVSQPFFEKKRLQIVYWSYYLNRKKQMMEKLHSM